ncbi:hypothetical protein [Azospirillum palustre]
MIFSPQFGKSNITSLQERQSRYHILIANEDRRSTEVISRIATVLGKFPHHACRTITFDRGTEFLSYKSLPLNSYFCNPHSPWQKGGVENANGRLRRYLPLGIPVAERNGAALSALAKRLNDTPRRCLDYRTPAEVFAANLAASKVGR